MANINFRTTNPTITLKTTNPNIVFGSIDEPVIQSVTHTEPSSDFLLSWYVKNNYHLAVTIKTNCTAFGVKTFTLAAGATSNELTENLGPIVGAGINVYATAYYREAQSITDSYYYEF